MRGITAERVARAVLQGYLKQKREVIVPWTMHIPIKLYQLVPGLVEWAMGRCSGQGSEGDALPFQLIQQRGHLRLRVTIAGAHRG